ERRRAVLDRRAARERRGRDCGGAAHADLRFLPPGNARRSGPPVHFFISSFSCSTSTRISSSLSRSIDTLFDAAPLAVTPVVPTAAGAAFDDAKADVFFNVSLTMSWMRFSSAITSLTCLASAAVLF